MPFQSFAVDRALWRIMTRGATRCMHAAAAAADDDDDFTSHVFYPSCFLSIFFVAGLFPNRSRPLTT